MNEIPFWNLSDNQSMARKLRLAVVKNLYIQKLLSRYDAIQLLSGELTPGDASTVFNDSIYLDVKPEARDD